MVGVSSTYISQLEQENIDPPTAERASKMASALILGLAFLAIVCSPCLGRVKFVLLRKAWSPENRNTSNALWPQSGMNFYGFRRWARIS